MIVTKQQVQEYDVRNDPRYAELMEQINEQLLLGKRVYDLPEYANDAIATQLIKDYKLGEWNVNLYENFDGDWYLEFS